MSENDLRYPIGKFVWPKTVTREQRESAIGDIAALPARFRDAVRGLSAEQLDTPYREGGWTARQVVHHVPDSHMNSYIRFKLALTEDKPIIKPYDEAAWARLEDSRGAIEPSLQLLEALHERWVALMRAMTAEEWKREFVHPERGPMALDVTVALYAWHSAHHLAHITRLRESRGW
jgi:uncharacterized damage-inducible protein DinB